MNFAAKALLLILFGFAPFCFGFLLRNVQSGLCAKDSAPKAEQYFYTFERCRQNGGTQFTLLDGSPQMGSQLLSSEWVQPSGEDPKKKCAWGWTRYFPNVYTANCTDQENCVYYQWTFKEIGNDKFVIYHTMDMTVNAWCLKPISGEAKLVKNCNETDPASQWTMI